MSETITINKQQFDAYIDERAKSLTGMVSFENFKKFVETLKTYKRKEFWVDHQNTAWPTDKIVPPFVVTAGQAVLCREVLPCDVEPIETTPQMMIDSQQKYFNRYKTLHGWFQGWTILEADRRADVLAKNDDIDEGLT